MKSVARNNTDRVKRMKQFEVFEIVVVLLTFFSIVVTWTRNIAIPQDQIPSVINGMVTSISMIVGFSGAIMIFTLSKQWDKLELGKRRPLIYLVLIGLPLALLWTIYSYFLGGNFEFALRLSMSDLAISSTILIDFLAYYARETVIYLRGKSQKSVSLK